MMVFQPRQKEGLSQNYLQISDLQRLEHLSFSSRRTVEGQYSGQHATPQRGKSVEFRDYRQYIPGDELSNVDWKVYGRSDKLFIKIFEHQADLTAHLLVDASASMAFRGIRARRSQPVGYAKRTRGGKDAGLPLSKYDCACGLAAGLAFLIVKEKDRVSFAAAREGLHEHLPPSSSVVNLSGILKAMERINPSGEAQLSQAIRELAGKSRKRDLLIVFSDLLGTSGEIMNALSLWLHRGGEVIVFHVMHAEELTLPVVPNGIFIDSETDERIRLNVEDIRPEYDARMKVFLDGWSQTCRGNGIDYVLSSTAEPYHEQLFRFLTRRAASA
jgi:uncharacterized protein (DUF58 family)